MTNATTYLSPADTAKLVRAALKRSFPGVKFSVTSSKGSGSSIDIAWTNGPTDGMVSAVSGQFKGGSFDGMIDMAVSHTSWLMPDGTACVASNDGTQGSMGTIPAERNWMPCPEAKLVHFGAKFIFTRRSMTPDFAERALAAARRRYDLPSLRVVISRDGTGYITGDWADESQAFHVTSKFMSMTAGA